MEILIAIELIAIAIFLIVFGGKKLERELAQRSYQRQLNSYDHEGDDATKKYPAAVTKRLG